MRSSLVQIGQNEFFDQFGVFVENFRITDLVFLFIGKMHTIFIQKVGLDLLYGKENI